MALGLGIDESTNAAEAQAEEDPSAEGPSLVFEEPKKLPPCGTSGELRSCTLAKEPTFDVGPDDELWVTGAGAVGLTSQIWYSPDLGDTFEHVGFQGTDAGRHTAGAEGDVAVDPEGTAYLFDTNLAQGWWTIFEDPLLPATSIPLSFADETPTSGSVSPTDDTDRPWLVSLGEGEVFFTYNNGDTTYRITRDGGLTWSQQIIAAECNVGRPLHMGGERFAFVSACLVGSPEDDGSITWTSAPHLYIPQGPAEPDPLGSETDNWEKVPIRTPVHDGSGDPVDRDALPIMDLAHVDDTWFIVGADEPDQRAYISWGNPDEGWQTAWLGPSNRSWFPAVDAREDGFVGVAYPSQEDGTWVTRTELRAVDGSILDSTVVDEGPIAPSEQEIPTAIGDFIDVGWLPDDRLLVAYGDTPSSSESVVEGDSRISVARATLEG